jgi:hypothetical protein
MKKLVFPFLVIAVIFSACKKEEETPTNNTATTYAFSCKINGADFTDNNPSAIVDPSTNVFTIDAEDGANSIRLIIYNFSNRTANEQISLNNLTDKAYVILGTDEYTNTQSGQLIFSNIGNPLSGTFNVICKNANFQPVTVTEGEFVNVTY